MRKNSATINSGSISLEYSTITYRRLQQCRLHSLHTPNETGHVCHKADFSPKLLQGC